MIEVPNEPPHRDMIRVPWGAGYRELRRPAWHDARRWTLVLALHMIEVGETVESAWREGPMLFAATLAVCVIMLPAQAACWLLTRPIVWTVRVRRAHPSNKDTIGEANNG